MKPLGNRKYAGRAAHHFSLLQAERAAASLAEGGVSFPELTTRPPGGAIVGRIAAAQRLDGLDPNEGLAGVGVRCCRIALRECVWYVAGLVFGCSGARQQARGLPLTLRTVPGAPGEARLGQLRFLQHRETGLVVTRAYSSGWKLKRCWVRHVTLWAFGLGFGRPASRSRRSREDSVPRTRRSRMTEARRFSI